MKRFKYIHQLTKKEIEELYNIVQNKDMKYLGKGKKWNYNKINELIKYSKKDYIEKFKNSNYLYIILFDNNKIIGLGYIHPGIYKYSNYLQPAIIIKSTEQGKGYSKIFLNKLIKLSKKYFKKGLIGISKQTNIKSNNLAKHYLKIDEILINKQKYNVYDLYTFIK